MSYQEKLTGHAQNLALEQYLIRWGKLSYSAVLRALENDTLPADVAVRAHYQSLPPRVLANLIQDASQRIRFSTAELMDELTADMTALLAPTPGHARVCWVADVLPDTGEPLERLVERAWQQNNLCEVIHPAHPSTVLQVRRETPA